MPAKVTTVAVATPDEEIADLLEQPEDFEDGLAVRTVRFRGVTYKMSELEVGEYNKIEKLATTTSEEDDGMGGSRPVEKIDSALLDRLKVMASMKSPRKGDPDYRDTPKLGTRVYLALLRLTNELCFTQEIDEIAAEKAKAKLAKATEGNKPGN